MDLNDLERLAKAATPGPWVADGCHVYATEGPLSPSWAGTCPSNMVISTGCGNTERAAYIAAWSPDVALRFVDGATEQIRIARKVAAKEKERGDNLLARAEKAEAAIGESARRSESLYDAGTELTKNSNAMRDTIDDLRMTVCALARLLTEKQP